MYMWIYIYIYIYIYVYIDIHVYGWLRAFASPSMHAFCEKGCSCFSVNGLCGVECCVHGGGSGRAKRLITT